MLGPFDSSAGLVFNWSHRVNDLHTPATAIPKIILHHFRHIAQQKHHAVESLGAQHGDEVLEERLAMNFEHGFGPDIGKRAEALAATTGKNDRLRRPTRARVGI